MFNAEVLANSSCLPLFVVVISIKISIICIVIDYLHTTLLLGLRNILPIK